MYCIVHVRFQPVHVHVHQCLSCTVDLCYYNVRLITTRLRKVGPQSLVVIVACATLTPKDKCALSMQPHPSPSSGHLSWRDSTDTSSVVQR